MEINPFSACETAKELPKVLAIISAGEAARATQAESTSPHPTEDDSVHPFED